MDSPASGEREYLRALARQVLEYAQSPQMRAREALWYRHNARKGERPMVVMELNTFAPDIMPPLQCESELGKLIEHQLQEKLVNERLIKDDKVISPFFDVPWQIHLNHHGLTIRRVHAKDSQGRSLGFADEHVLRELPRDLEKLRPSEYWVDRAATARIDEQVMDLIGDILPVRRVNRSLDWHPAPSMHAVHMMGLEALMVAMIDEPDAVTELYRLITDDILRYVDWQASEGLLVLNNRNDYAGAGSYGFTDELPTGCRETGRVLPRDLWGNMNSQETVCISPAMYEELVAPHYRRIADHFGLMYYGCCEPVHAIYARSLASIPNLRKVSVSPWCDQAAMGEMLAGSRVIFSRKPSPNYVGVGARLDEDAFRAHVMETLRAARRCKLEFICRDIYALNGDPTKPGQAVGIIRACIDSLW